MSRSIAHVSTALPEYHYSREKLLRAGAQWLGAGSESYEIFSRFIRSSQIEERYFAQPIEEILALEGASARAESFLRGGKKLALQVVADALETTGLEAREVGTIIFTSCSVPLIPTLDVHIVNELGFESTVRRVPLYQYGCAGGAAGLALASSFATEERSVLLVSVELCSLVFQRGDLERGNLVGSAIFADGAACAVIPPSDGLLRFCAARSHLIPHSTDLMGYDLRDDGTHLRLSRALPERLALELPRAIADFLGSHGLEAAQIEHWLVHPGGVKILSAIEELFELESSSLRWAWEVLERYGNISSASLLYVLERFLKEGRYESGDYVLMIGVGPGLSVELLLFSVQR